MPKNHDPQKIEKRFLDIVEGVENLKIKKQSPPPTPVPTAKGPTKMHLTFRDGFNFGCGFFVANLVAALLMGLVVFALIMISTVIGLAGLTSLCCL